MRAHRNCCGLDVHKKMIAACLLMEDAEGNSVTETRLFGCMTRELHALAQWLCAAQVTAVAMEATGFTGCRSGMSWNNTDSSCCSCAGAKNRQTTVKIVGRHCCPGASKQSFTESLHFLA
jgi:hypothetical protein